MISIKILSHFFLIFLICFIFISCPAKKPIKKPTKPQAEKPVEITTPPSAPETLTPQRRASNKLVQKGIIELDKNNYVLAIQIFQEAINIDATNGEAYYYLALTNNYLGEKNTALGLLDKAESLLNNDPSWIEKIEALRSDITGEKSKGMSLPPLMDEF